MTDCLTPTKVREVARAIAASIAEEGETARLGVFVCDDGAALITTRSGLVTAVYDVAARRGVERIEGPLRSVEAFAAQITNTPAWKVPIVLWTGDHVQVAEFVPARGVA